MVVPMMAAAAGAAAAGAPGAQADELSNLDDVCLECAGIGITPCTWGLCLGSLWPAALVAMMAPGPLPGRHSHVMGTDACDCLLPVHPASSAAQLAFCNALCGVCVEQLHLG